MEHAEKKIKTKTLQPLQNITTEPYIGRKFSSNSSA